MRGDAIGRACTTGSFCTTAGRRTTGRFADFIYLGGRGEWGVVRADDATAGPAGIIGKRRARMTRRAGAILTRVAAGADESAPTDRELLRRFAGGEEAAFAVLVARHAHMVLGVCRRLLPTAEDAEDACQATFLILARKAKGGRWQNSLANWLHTTARWVAAKARRTMARRNRREGRAAVPEAVAPADTITGSELLAI